MQHLIEVKLSELNQLFNSMDPSPFHERDLDPRAEAFIVSWAQEHPREVPLKLVVHLTKPALKPDDPEGETERAVRHYFDYLADMKWREFRQLMREGRVSLLIGISFITLCQITASAMVPAEHPWQGIASEGLSIGGWVAMWRPLEIYLYRWWPLLRLRRIYQRLARVTVEIRQPSP